MDILASYSSFSLNLIRLAAGSTRTDVVGVHRRWFGVVGVCQAAGTYSYPWMDSEYAITQRGCCSDKGKHRRDTEGDVVLQTSMNTSFSLLFFVPDCTMGKRRWPPNDYDVIHLVLNQPDNYSTRNRPGTRCLERDVACVISRSRPNFGSFWAVNI